MPTYIYKGLDKDKKETTGKVVASSKLNAIVLIKEMGHFPTSIKEQKKFGKNKNKSIRKKSKNIKKISYKDLITFMRQFATLIDAGLPILRSLRILEKQNKGRNLSTILQDVGDSIESGNSLSHALGAYEKIFSPLFVNMVHAGEVGGVLDTVLLQMADYFEKNSKLMKKVKASLIYPVFIMIIALIIVTSLIIFIVPKFKEMFVEMNLELPQMTKILIGISDNIQSSWYIPIISFLCLFILFKYIMKNQKGRYAIHNLLYRIPLIGDLISKVAIARFSRTFGTLINSGVQILEALTITRATIENAVVEDAITLVHDNLKEGESIIQPLNQANIFPPMVISMISVGEETGKLPDMLLKIADSFEDDIDTTITGMTSLIEPILIISLAGIVGFIVIAMFMPLVSLISNMT